MFYLLNLMQFFPQTSTDSRKKKANEMQRASKHKAKSKSQKSQKGLTGTKLIADGAELKGTKQQSAATKK